MKKRIISLCLLVALSLTLFAACSKKDTTISTTDAQKIALQALGKTAAEVGHSHVEVTQYEGTPCFMIHVTADGHEHYVYVDLTGKVLHKQ